MTILNSRVMSSRVHKGVIGAAGRVLYSPGFGLRPLELRLDRGPLVVGVALQALLERLDRGLGVAGAALGLGQLEERVAARAHLGVGLAAEPDGLLRDRQRLLGTCRPG